MNLSIKPIETVYRGYKFRSRLEARWAVYFDALNLKWEYEKEGFDLDGFRYLPDFWLCDVQMWAEVKGSDFTAIEYEKCRRLTVRTGYECLLLSGVPDTRSYLTIIDCPELDNEIDYMISSDGFVAAPSPILEDFEQGERFENVALAVVAARSARFEFGQSGATL